MKKLIKNPLLYLGLAIFSVIVHNAFYAVFKAEEGVFFSGFFIFSIIFLFMGVGYLFKFVSEKLRKKAE